MCFSVLGGETEASKGEGMELESKQNPTSAEYFCLSGCVMGRLLGSLSILEASLYVGATAPLFSQREK